MSLFTTLDEGRICQEIAQARNSVVIATAGVTRRVASALLEAHQRLGPGRIQVVLDVSANVARLGFGEHQAVALLRTAGLDLRHQPGLRIGVLLCDEHGWSFAGTPRLVESDPVARSGAFNAIALTTSQALVLRGELPQATPVAAEASIGPALPLPVVGNQKLDSATIERVSNALKIAGPQQFDLARQTQVYSAFIVFIELESEGFKVQRRRITLPKSLPLLASKDKNVKDRLAASLSVLQEVDSSLSSNKSRPIWKSCGGLSYPGGKAGRVMLKRNRAEFERRLKAIEDNVQSCKAEIQNDLQAKLNALQESLCADLARAVLVDPPLKFVGRYELSEESARLYVKEQLQGRFPTAASLVKHMKVHRYYKDVTYETLNDPEFKDRLLSIIPDNVLKGALLEEDIAAIATVAK